MVDKKGKHKKHNDHPEQKIPETGGKKSNISDDFLDQIQDAFSDFEKIPEPERIELYGDKKYLEQFWEHFKIQYPHLLDKIDKKDLPTYIKALEKKGFSIDTIKKNAGKLSEQFKSEDTEQHIIEQSLSQLQKFCEDKKNNIPDNTFKKFADAVGFTHDTLVISSDGNIKIIDDLPVLWNEFLKKEGIDLEETAAEKTGRILTPDYNPTERIMVTVALTKIKKELKGTLRTAFDAQFPLPITIFSTYQDLINFKTEWIQFLDIHSTEIDKSLAKKLDSIIVTNGDIQKGLLQSKRKFNDTKGFSEHEKKFNRIFNNLVTRQLFDQVEKTQKNIEHHVQEIGNMFREFPPYVNDILSIYPFNAKIISSIDTTYISDFEHIDIQINDLNNQYAGANDTEKKELRDKIKILKQQKEHRRWQAYIAFLKTKDSILADIFTQLVASKFDFSVLSAEHQQSIVDTLIKNKLEDSIKNKIPELLDVKEEELTQFVHDLFDLKKMDLVIPTRHGPVPLTFLKKEFLANVRSQVPAISDLEDLQNLPLNFVTQLTENNAAFFEESLIFHSLYTDFNAKDGKKFRINDAYKVKIQKDGKTVEGYLSAYAPIKEYNDKGNGQELYLYTQPITAPNQERELVTRKNNDGTPSLIPVVIKDTEQQSCDMEILDKKLNLNGDAFGALLFGYVLGQQSMNTTMSPAQEKALAEKFGKLNVYQDKTEDTEEKDGSTNVDVPKNTLEKSEKEKFIEERKKLKGYGFPEEQYKENNGFVEGTRLFLPFADSEVYPIENGKAWLQMEIINIDEKKGTFTVKIHGGELRLGKHEGAKKEFSMNTESLSTISTIFGNTMYKIPDTSKYSMDQQMNILQQCSPTDLDKCFGSLKFDGSKFVYELGNYIGKDVTHFGLYEPKAIGESIDNNDGKLILYKIKSNPNGTINVSGDSMAGNESKHYPSRDMDYTTFILFIKEKKLQPKCKEQLQSITANISETKEETPTTVRGFSINNVFDFFKSTAKSITDGINKYDTERTEELTDILTQKGQLWNSIGGFLSPFGRVSGAFETMGMDAFLNRDNRIWAKIEKRNKYYEDFDYTKIYFMYIKPMLDGKIKIVPHYKMAALLLAHLKKGKGPYAKDPQSTAKGNRIGALLGSEHQQKYQVIREKKIRDLEQNSDIHSSAWADDIKNQLVELEMRYIVHVMDGREMGAGDDDKYYFQNKYSKKFCDELEGAYNTFFKQNTVEEGFTKAQDNNFEFARVEYFRQLADRPQQALPYLKVMATKAINDTQWRVFETAVLAGILSGVFLNMTYSSTQSYIQKICRTRGFIPGIFAKDINQQSKIQRLLDLFSDNKFSKATNYSSTDYSYRDTAGPTKDGPGKFITSFVNWTDSGSTRKDLSKFLELTGKNVNGKTLLDLYADPNLGFSDKLLLQEYIEKSNEKNEGLDPDVEKNTSSLTGSILTKSQSVVEQMIQIDQQGFKGKDGDAKQNMEEFSKKMQEAIPSEKNISESKAKFFIEKFFNRFPGFSGVKKLELLKRLKWCQEHSGSGEVDDIMYYSIVGEIIASIASRDAHMPEALEGALRAWTEFFKNNLNVILRPGVVAAGFGNQYKADIEKYTPELEPWETASLLLDKQDSIMYINTLPTNEQKVQARMHKRTLERADGKYINGSLYLLATDLSRKCSSFTTNVFKKDINEHKKSITSSVGNKATGAHIKNTEILNNLKQIHEGKPLEETDPNEYVSPIDEDDYNNY